MGSSSHDKGIINLKFLQSLEAISYDETPWLFTKAVFNKNELKRRKHYWPHGFQASDGIKLLINAYQFSDGFLLHARSGWSKEKYFTLVPSEVKENILYGQQSSSFNAKRAVNVKCLQSGET